MGAAIRALPPSCGTPDSPSQCQTCGQRSLNLEREHQRFAVKVHALDKFGCMMPTFASQPLKH